MKKFLCGVLVCLLSGNLLAKDVSNVGAVKSNTISKSAVSTVSNVSNTRTAAGETSNEKFVVQNEKMAPLRQMNYQGWLGNTLDTTGVTGIVNMKFAIYGDSMGGASLWDETQAGIVVIKGIFNVLLGSSSSLPIDIFDGSPLWLQTIVGTDTLFPRKKIVHTGYAIRADNAGYADYAGIALATGDTQWITTTSYIYPKKAPEFKLYSTGIGLCFVGNTDKDAITNWNKDNTQSLINYRDSGNHDRYAGKFITNGDSSATDYGIYAKSGGEYAGYFDGNVKVTGRLKALNLPGVVSTSSNRHITLAVADSIADSVVVNVPDSGVVVVTLTGVFQYNHTNGISDIARASISTTRALTYYNLSLISTAANDETSSDFYLPYTTTLTEEVVAGSHIYYAAFDTYSGQAETIRYFLTATYYPKSYGTVTKSFKNDKNQNGPESR
jgi:hypothetical protein